MNLESGESVLRVVREAARLLDAPMNAVVWNTAFARITIRVPADWPSDDQTQADCVVWRDVAHAWCLRVQAHEIPYECDPDVLLALMANDSALWPVAVHDRREGRVFERVGLFRDAHDQCAAVRVFMRDRQLITVRAAGPHHQDGGIVHAMRVVDACTVEWESVAPPPTPPLAIISHAGAYVFAPPVANVQLHLDATGQLPAVDTVSLSVRRQAGWSGACTVRLQPAASVPSAEDAVVHLLEHARAAVSTTSGSVIEERPFPGGSIGWASFTGVHQAEVVWGACVVRRHDEMDLSVTLCCPDVAADPLAWAANQHLLRRVVHGQFLDK